MADKGPLDPLMAILAASESSAAVDDAAATLFQVLGLLVWMRTIIII